MGEANKRGSFVSTQPERKPFRVPPGKYWNEFYRKWMPDPEQKKVQSK